jgi:transposase-like protein
MMTSRVSWCNQSRFVELFVAGVTVRTVKSLVNVNKTRANYYWHRLRQLMRIALVVGVKEKKVVVLEAWCPYLAF